MPDFGLSALSLAPSLLGLGGSIYGLSQGAPSANLANNPPQSYLSTPQGQWLMGQVTSGVNNLPGTDLGRSVLPMGQDAATSLYNNPGAGMLTQGAMDARNVGLGTAYGQLGAGQALTGAGFGMLPYSQAVMNTGFDPQGALYARTVQQLQDQMRAGQTARGIGTTPYGAGLENQGLSNFNIDWQNAQLGRQLQGLQGGLAGLGGAQSAVLAGQGLTSAVPGQIASAGALPFNAYSTIGQGQMGALGSLLGLGQGAQNLAATPLNLDLAALGVGNQGASVANSIYGNQITAANQGFNQNRMMGQDLGRSLYGIGQWASGNNYNPYGTGWGQPGGVASTMQYGGQAWPMYT